MDALFSELKSASRNFIENIDFIKHKIDKKMAYTGIIAGFAIFAFSLFLTWSGLKDSTSASDGGVSSGWAEEGYVAIVPLIIALYPVFLNKRASVYKTLLSAIFSFGLLGYNNVAHRSTWITQSQFDSDGDILALGGQNMGSDLGSGFWIGLIAMIVIFVCGLAWSLHTSVNNKEDV